MVDMRRARCSHTGLSVRADGIAGVFILHKTQRHVHHIAIDAIEHMLSARCTDGGVRIDRAGGGVVMRCGAPLNDEQMCERWIGIGRIRDFIHPSETTKKYTTATQQHKHKRLRARLAPTTIATIDDLLHRLWFRAHERAGLVHHCTQPACTGSGGFVVDRNHTGQRIMCPCCGSQWCRDCKHDHHGSVCPDHDTDAPRLIIDDIQTCPQCKTGVTKSDGIGCDHMQCICGCYFCYVCGTTVAKQYNVHVRYSPQLGTYVCPLRLSSATPVAIKSGMINGQSTSLPPIKLKHWDSEYDDDAYDTDDDDD